MSSRVLAARELILAALDAGGISSATTGRFAAPCVHVEPGDPWSEPAALKGGASGRRLTRWRLTAIAGRADSDAAFVTLGELVDAVDDALVRLSGAQLPVWGKPTDYLLDGVAYASAIATVQLTV
jgi:hypothetical protein